MSKTVLVALALLSLVSASSNFLGDKDVIAAAEVNNGDKELTKVGVANILVGDECIEEIVRIDDLIELLSEFQASPSQSIEKLTFLNGGITSIMENCASAFSSPALMDCSNDVEGIQQKIETVIAILSNNPDADYERITADSLARAKDKCVIPVASEVCSHQIEASLEDTARLLADVYGPGSEEVTVGTIFNDAESAARELKTMVYACSQDTVENEIYDNISEAVKRVLLVIEACQDEFKETAHICETIDGEELQEMVYVFEENGVLQAESPSSLLKVNKSKGVMVDNTLIAQE